MREASETLIKQYHLRHAKSKDYRNKFWKILCKEFLSKHILKTSSVLDLGCGWGEFINNITAAEKYAMDLNPDSRKYLSPDVKYISQDSSQKWAIESNSLDVVFTSNFLEHLPNKAAVSSVISEAYRSLKHGGLLICMGPNIKFVAGAYWDFWDHNIPITESSCSEILKLQDFNIKQCIPRFLPYTMSAGVKPPLCLVRYYLKLPILWHVFGKQFLIVGQK